MTSKLAVNTDGELTYCSASEENLGKGRCNHIVHQKYESAEDFTKAVENNIEAIKEYAQKDYGYDLIGKYVVPSDASEWEKCPACGLRPKTWTFDNGRTAACGCGTGKYNHLSIEATPILKFYQENESLENFDDEELKKNWNDYCETGNLENARLPKER